MEVLSKKTDDLNSVSNLLNLLIMLGVVICFLLPDFS